MNYNVEFVCDHMVVMTTVEIPGGHFNGWDNDYDINHEIMMMANRTIYEVYGFEPREFSYDYQIHGDE